MTRPLTEHVSLTEPHPRIGFVNLGCPKALVDSERILTPLRAEGYEIAPSYETPTSWSSHCGFIEAAIDESLCAIDEAWRRTGA